MNQTEITDLTREKPFKPLWQVVYEGLKAEIITLKIEPGTRINEKSLAEKMGISRSPLKMAIDKLIDDTLIAKEPGHSPVVTQLDFATYGQIIHARRAIESEAAYIAAKVLTPAELDTMAAVLQEFNACKPEDKIRCSELDDQFHQLIIDAANNVYLSRMYDMIRPWLSRYRYYLAYYTKRNYYTEYPSYHEAIYHALSHHLSELARSEIIFDITRMENMILDLSYRINNSGFETEKEGN
jgi:DNA-binding GntR family transcriptional regulator